MTPSSPSDRTSAFVSARRAALKLQPHPEGGWYAEVYRSSSTLALARGQRALLTLIHYVLEGGAHSAWHRVRGDEVWSFVAGDPLELHMLDDAGQHQVVRLGPDLLGGDAPAAVVPAGMWQAALATGATGSHVTCTVAPGFDFADFALADVALEAARNPRIAELWQRFASGVHTR